MFKFADVRLPMKPVRGPSCRLLAAGAGLLGLLASCTGPTKPAQAVQPAHTTPRIPLTNRELVFDERYLDSISAGPPFSAGTQRQMAIQFELDRLDLANRPMSPELDALDDTIAMQAKANGPLVKFPNKAALLANIYRRIDSLKTLEHNPLTPHK